MNDRKKIVIIVAIAVLIGFLAFFFARPGRLKLTSGLGGIIAKQKSGRFFKNIENQAAGKNG
ncbi:MAG: hypothetical protein M1467_00165 [Deltaproteobacteria bacterium]|nr:hypothetical protein [Deltaproteobacteria bacterium]